MFCKSIRRRRPIKLNHNTYLRNYNALLTFNCIIKTIMKPYTVHDFVVNKTVT